MTTFVLLNNVSADTNGAPVNPNGAEGVVLVKASSFGGGTVYIELSSDNVTWVPVTYQNSPMAFTANDVKLMRKAPAGMYLRARLTGSTSPSNVYVEYAE